MVENTLREHIAFALFTNQLDCWDVLTDAAELEWDVDEDLREFWLGQADVVMKEIERWRQSN